MKLSIVALTAILMLMNACYSSQLIGTVDYALSQLPEKPRPARFDHLSSHSRRSGEHIHEKTIAVFVDQPRWGQIRKEAKKIARLSQHTSLNIYFFSTDLRVPNISKDGVIPETSEPYIAAIYRYRKKINYHVEHHPEAFERAQEHFNRLDMFSHKKGPDPKRKTGANH